jgi:hypothetical protein
MDSEAVGSFEVKDVSGGYRTRETGAQSGGCHTSPDRSIHTTSTNTMMNNDANTSQAFLFLDASVDHYS